MSSFYSISYGKKMNTNKCPKTLCSQFISTKNVICCISVTNDFFAKVRVTYLILDIYKCPFFKSEGKCFTKVFYKNQKGTLLVTILFCK